ncbi:CCAAT/enhancer-binding protein beta [Portunus trituberculatus]|uniref:CCAAT/enhancer-binding protein beta n=1 Tax=Portunus trituberculatus TaxID=210409 RepID=A0A5B7F7U0_PORTR|nr:CCAAT/enhancer-binding protein beta [Portunus trituberculatus]
MESPQLYDSSDYKKGAAASLKVKGNLSAYSNEEYGDLAELNAPEISLDLHNLIDDSQFSEGFIQGIEGLSVDKSPAPRGLGVNMYNPLAYLPQPVHGASQFDRQYQDRGGHDHLPIKEEPQESPHPELQPHEYSSCARVGAAAAAAGYGAAAAAGYPTGVPAYSNMTPTTVPGADSLCRSPLKSPTGGKMMPGCKKNVDKSSDEYKRRRERNNIAKLVMDNDRLHKKCELLSKEVAVFHSMFANVHCLPDHVQRELRKQMEAFSQQHQHLVNM